MDKIYQKSFPGVKTAGFTLIELLINKCHSRGMLSGISRFLSCCVLLVSGGEKTDPRQKHSGMTALKHLRMTAFNRCRITTSYGFTLIELLVVVLIIGILAAVALPQYQVAVARSKYVQLMGLAETYIKAEQRHVMANGEYSFDFADLDIAPPAGWTIIQNGRSIQSARTGAWCTLQDGSGAGAFPTPYCQLKTMVYYPVYSTSQKLCGARTADSVANKVCKSLGGTFYSTVGGGATTYYSLP